MDGGKLVELLNEYETKRRDKSSVFQRTYKLATDTIRRTHTNLDSGWDTDFDNTNREIVSKDYGFIEWLVDNDKLRDLESYEYLEDYYGGTFGDDENVIMKLAISKTPIDDLIKLLK